VLNIGAGTTTISCSGRPLAARDFDRHDTWLDVGQARAVLDWSATTSLADGLRSTWRALGPD